MFTCMKCDKQGTILLRQKDYYCEDCFVTNINHKFRASIGKNKILSPNENVLICLSGGIGSTTLLDLVKNGLALDNHKKLWITPIFFHIIGISDVSENAVSKSLIQQCNNSNFNIYLSHMSEYIQPTKINLELNNIPEVNEEHQSQMKYLLNSMQPTTQNDYISKIKRDIFICCAKELNCTYIFTGETTSRLAVNLLSNLTLGRGSQVQHDIGFCDARSVIKIIRPMKDITREELGKYIKIKQLLPAKSEILQPNSLQCVIQTFVNNLQDNFPSTISTVCKTAEKIGIESNNDKIKCVICKSNIGKRNSKMSALEATNYSRTLSVGQNKSTVTSDNQSMLLFPYVDEYFCYACSKNYQEMEQTTIPSHIKEYINN